MESGIQTSDEETNEPIVNKISVRRRSVVKDLPPITESQKKEKLTKIFMEQGPY